ncbi:MAG: malate dehydrogenase [Deltaproteobacteria bacterium]|nr:MAG: malate dehydrogenase [Deltaproteobacteria bacterium]
MITKDEALRYHSQGRKGKIEVISTKPCDTQKELSLAYSPGVAEPCLEIAKDPKKSYEYTARGNLVGVISNGTAVLGLGDIGPEAGKPVMEGKGILFKKFADIDVFDIEINEKDPEKFVQIVKALEPTFGGINLEDIKGPECFYIEQKLIELMNIPVFHDDQHGTAVITTAGLINALDITGKKAEDLKIVFSGAGAAGIACAKMIMTLGISKEQIILCDSKGVVHTDRPNLEPAKAFFAQKTSLRTLEEAFVGADLFVGVSGKGLVTSAMLKSMAKNPIVFAMANPDPEITYHDAKEARSDVIMATGRSDYPNQVNNVLGFPFIFRGTLDVGATKINEQMKLAAAQSLAALTREDIPEEVCRAYGNAKLSYGPDYIIPKPLDPRVLLWEAPAVAEAAIKSGVAQRPYSSKEAYRQSLESKMKKRKELVFPMYQDEAVTVEALEKEMISVQDHVQIKQAYSTPRSS